MGFGARAPRQRQMEGAASALVEECAEEAAGSEPAWSSDDVLAVGVAPFLAELTTASRLAVEASVLAFGAWGRVVWLVLQPISRLAVAAWPSVRSGLATLAASAAAQPRKAIAIEVLALLALIALVRIIRFVRRRQYVSRARAALRRRRDRFVAGVARRSRVLAAALPHIGYLLACVACSRVAERLGLRSRWLALLLAVEPALATGLPAARTLLATSGSAAEQQHCLQYWVVWACAHLSTGLLLAVPLSSRMFNAALPLLDRFPMLRELPFFFWLWLQLPGGPGLRLAYSTLAPELQRRSNAASALIPSPPARLTGALHMLMATLIGFESRTALSEAVRESGVLLGGSIFLLTPTPIASVGLLLHALGGPTLRTIEALAAAEPSAAAGVAQLRYWLSYAMLCGALRLVEPALRWVPFVTHLQLFAVLWLQLPFFRTIFAGLRRLARLAIPSGRGGTPDEVRVSEEEVTRPNALYSSRLARPGASSRRASAT